MIRCFFGMLRSCLVAAFDHATHKRGQFSSPSRVPFIEMLECLRLFDLFIMRPSRVPFIEMLEFLLGLFGGIFRPSRVPFIEMLE